MKVTRKKFLELKTCIPKIIWRLPKSFRKSVSSKKGKTFRRSRKMHKFSLLLEISLKCEIFSKFHENDLREIII